MTDDADPDGGKDTERTTVRTYVPAYQKAEWESHAEEMGVSLSEFVRTMVQAGRADFPVPDPAGTVPDDADRDGPGTPREDDGDPTSGSRDDADRTGESFETVVLEVLERDEWVPWEELVDGAAENVEDRVYEVVTRLQEEGRVEHDPRNGYALVE